jgi:hypothetical protein
MKVDSTKNQALQLDNLNRAQTNRAGTQGRGGADEVGALTGKRDFASLLEEFSTSRDSRREGPDENMLEPAAETKEAETIEQAAGKQLAARRKEDEEAALHGAAFDAKGNMPMPATPEVQTIDARAILPFADLEKIIAAIQTQVVADGRSVVTLELTRSVLAGLRVRLSADASGRLTVNLIASDEKTRALIDARSQELSDLLRSHGLDLSSLGTGVAKDFSGRDDSGEQRDERRPDAGESVRVDASPGPIEEAGAVEEQTGPANPSSYYRA